MAGLSDLANSVLFELSTFLSLPEALALEGVTKTFRAALCQDHFWRLRCLREWAPFWDVGVAALEALKARHGSYRRVHLLHHMYGSLPLGQPQRLVRYDSARGLRARAGLPQDAAAPQLLHVWDAREGPHAPPAATLQLDFSAEGGLLRGRLVPQLPAGGSEAAEAAAAPPAGGGPLPTWTFQRAPGSGRRVYAASCATLAGVAADDASPAPHSALPVCFALEALPPQHLHTALPQREGAGRRAPAPRPAPLPRLPPPPPPHALAFTGEWCGHYGSHGHEVLHLRAAAFPLPMLPPAALGKGCPSAWPHTACQPFSGYWLSGGSQRRSALYPEGFERAAQRCRAALAAAARMEEAAAGAAGEGEGAGAGAAQAGAGGGEEGQLQQPISPPQLFFFLRELCHQPGGIANPQRRAAAVANGVGTAYAAALEHSELWECPDPQALGMAAIGPGLGGEEEEAEEEEEEEAEADAEAGAEAGVEIGGAGAGGGGAGRGAPAAGCYGGLGGHALVATKVCGDPNVPSGAHSWLCDLTRAVEVPAAERLPERAGEVVHYHPALCQINFREQRWSPRWIRGFVALRVESGGGRALEAVLSTRDGHNLVFAPV